MFNNNKNPDSAYSPKLTPQDLRSWERSNKTTGRRLPSKQVLAGIAATAAVLGVGLIKEGDIAQRDATADAADQERVVNAHPEIFDRSDFSTEIYETGVAVATEPYQVKPGDTAWGIATHVEANVDGIPGNQDVRPFVDDIVRQAGDDGLQPGDIIQLPAGSDVDPATGVQLTDQ